MKRIALFAFAFSPFIAVALAAQQPARGAGVCMSPAPSSGFSTRDSAGIRIAENWTPAQGGTGGSVRLAPQPRTVIGEGGGAGGSHVFGKVTSAVRFSDGRIVVADAQVAEIRVFDPSGRPVGTVGRKGQGPGEFNLIARLLRNAGDTLTVVEGTRLSHYGPSGTFLRTTTVPSVPFEHPPASPGGRAMRGSTFAQVIGGMPGGSWLATFIPTQRGEARTHVRRTVRRVARVDAAGTRTDSLLSGDGPEVLTYIFPDGGLQTHQVPWATVAVFAASTRGFFETSGRNYEIREHSPAGQVVRIYRICRPQQAITAAEITAISRAFADRETDPADQKKMLDVLAWLPRPTVKPTFDRLVVDELGRLWAREFLIPGASPMWHIFDLNGRHIVSVNTPVRNEVLEIGRDYVLTRMVDADNVESVRVYPLLGGGG